MSVNSNPRFTDFLWARKGRLWNPSWSVILLLRHKVCKQAHSLFHPKRDTPSPAAREDGMQISLIAGP